MTETIDELDLIRQCHEAYARHLATPVDGSVVDLGHTVICDPNVADAAKNMAVPRRQLNIDEAREVASAATEVFGNRKDWWLWSVFEQPALRELQFNKSKQINNLMVLAKDAFIKPPEVAGLEIVPVTNNAQVQAFERLRTEARGAEFPEYPESGKYLDESAISEHHHLWIGYLDGVPIATAAMFEIAHATMVKNIAVMPATRGRGIGKAISAFVIEQIDNIPVLDADPPADQLYKQIGFHDVGYLEFWATQAF